MTEHEGGATKSVVKVFDSSLESVDAAEALVMEAAKEVGFGEDERFEIGMAVRESMVNAVVHGNRYSANKKVSLSVIQWSQRIEVKVADQGNGFDIDSLPDPLAEENILKQSGRGILLIQTMVDEFEVRRVQPSGTEVKLVKHLRQPSSS